MAKIDSNKRIDINQYKDPWDKEMHNFAPGEENKFMEWFLDNANIYTSIDKGFTFEQTSDKNIQRNRCFGNSQYITNRYNKTYAEGFINYPFNEFLPFDINRYLIHGFNLENETVLDYTLNKVIMPECLPKEYFGIIIPKEFIIQNYNESDTYNKSLILDYWREIR